MQFLPRKTSAYYLCPSIATAKNSAESDLWIIKRSKTKLTHYEPDTKFSSDQFHHVKLIYSLSWNLYIYLFPTAKNIWQPDLWGTNKSNNMRANKIWVGHKFVMEP